MARTRAQREAAFKAAHGVSSGTYYEMRRKAQSRGISGKDFDRLRESAGYKTAKSVAQTAANNPTLAKHIVKASSLGVSPGTMRAVYAESGIDGAAAVARAGDSTEARYLALVESGFDPGGSMDDFDPRDYDLPDDYDWWYHG